MKNIFSLFERPFKIQKNDVFLFDISLFVQEILTFFYYANQISDDAILFATKNCKKLNKRYLWKYLSRLFLKLGTVTVHHKRNKMTTSMVLPQQLFWLQSLSVQKTNIPICNLEMRQRVLLGTYTVSILSYLLSIDCVGQMVLCLRQKLGILVLIKTAPVAKLLPWQTALRVSLCFFCDAHLWCQVSRTLLQYFQRYCLFSIHHFSVANNMTSSLI